MDFIAAADHMCIAMRRYQLGNPDAPVNGLSATTRQQILDMFNGTLFEDGEERHKAWLKAIRKGQFTICGKVDIDDYFPRGNDSWKAAALGTSFDMRLYPYKNEFLTSHWKHFHDAIQAHRFNVVYNILPKYGICAA